MHTSLSHFTGKEQNNLNHIIKRIVENIAPESVFCYGSRTVHEINRSCFTVKRKSESYSCSFDLVVIINDEEKLSEDVIYLFIESIARKYAQANIIVCRKGFVHQELLEGNFFFSWLYRSGILVYSREKLLRLPRHIAPKKGSIMYPETYLQFQQLLNDTQSFLSSAREHRKEKAYSMALYMAKQSVESSCRSLLYGCTGYQTDMRDLEKLLSHTQNITQEAVTLLPQNTREERRLLSLLIEATGTAHTNEFKNPTSIEVLILIDRAQQLKQVVETVIQKKTAVLQIPGNIPVIESSTPDEKGKTDITFKR